MFTRNLGKPSSDRENRLYEEIVTFCRAAQAGPIQPVAAAMKAFMLQHQYSGKDLETCLRKRVSNETAMKAWLQVFRENNLLALEKTGSIRPTEDRPGATAIQPTPPEVVYTRNIVTEATDCPGGTMIVGDRRTGRTLLALAMLYRLVKQNHAAVRILTTHTRSYLGLEKYPEVVSYAVGSAEDMLPEAARSIEEAYLKLLDRSRRNISALKKGQPVKHWEPLVLLIDGWTQIYLNFKDAGKADRKKLEADNILSQLKALAQTGDQVGITVMLVCDSHLQDHTGFSPVLIRGMSTIALGRLHRSNMDGGYGAAEKLVNDNSLITEGARKQLRSVMTQLAAEELPFIMALKGKPRLSTMKALRPFDRAEVDYGPIVGVFGGQTSAEELEENPWSEAS